MGFWANAGKPDFARCAEFISRFDPELRESLSRSEMKVLQWSLFYAWDTGVKNPQGGLCFSFSQTKLGVNLHRSRWTVLRALASLKKRGLISSLFRRPAKDGTWQTCLYFLGDKLKAILSRILGGTKTTRPCSKTAPQEFLQKTLRQDDSSLGVVVLPERQQSGPIWNESNSISSFAKLKSYLQAKCTARSAG